MKVLIWIHKNDVISGKITKYYKFGPPQSTNWPDYVQVEITRDEFVKLEDNEIEFISEEEMDKLEAEVDKSNQWNIDQFNRNRDFKDQINNIDDIISDQDDQPFAD
tara:strand:- start:1950 stop:2267 length:318 start_codon:yes stop_codon:yes gene_type:complete